MTIRPPTYAELTEACQRAYAVTGDAEYLKAIGGIEEARDVRQRALWADGRETDAAGTQPPPDLRLASCAGAAWQRFGSEVQGVPCKREPDAPAKPARSRRFPHPALLGGSAAVSIVLLGAQPWYWLKLTGGLAVCGLLALTLYAVGCRAKG